MFSIMQSMKFNHISFPSRDVAATAAFFARYLGCTVSDFSTSKIVKRHDFDIVIEDACWWKSIPAPMRPKRSGPAFDKVVEAVRAVS